MHQLATTYRATRDQADLEPAFAALCSDARRQTRVREVNARQLNIGLLTGNVAVWLYAAGSVLHQL